MSQTIELKINENSSIPKYKQIVDSILGDIKRGNIKLGEKIPSINELSEMCYLSRDTVEKAYKILRERQIIESVKGKGYYISNMDRINKINIFFLVNKPSTYKMMIYDSFVNAIGAHGQVDMYVYHCDETLFSNAIQRNLGNYDYYVVMSHFRDANSNHVSYTPETLLAMEQIPKDKLILLDNTKPGLDGKYSTIYQDFKNDIYYALNEGLEKILRYDKMILVYPQKSAHPYPRRIVHGFQQFCREHDIDFEILEEVYEDMEFKQRDIFITIQERDLVNLMRQVRNRNLTLGKDLGIISYNETPLKELLDITVISTDFKAMGECAAYMVLKNKKEQVKNVFKYIERNSL